MRDNFLQRESSAHTDARQRRHLPKDISKGGDELKDIKLHRIYRIGSDTARKPRQNVAKLVLFKEKT
jgi:hypothetical protein